MKRITVIIFCFLCALTIKAVYIIKSSSIVQTFSVLDIDDNSQIKYVQLKDVDSDGFHKEAILYVEADSIKSYFHIPNPINAKNIDIVGINKDDKGWMLILDWGGGNWFYNCTYYFAKYRNEYYLYDAEIIRTKSDGDEKEYKLKIEKNIEMSKFVLDQYLR